MALTNDEKRQLDQLERRGDLPILRDMARRATAPFYWYESGAAVDSVFHNGTACFVRTGTELLMITCDHVLEGWLSASAANPNLVCQVGSVEFEPTRYLVDRDADLDLATFSITDVLLSAIGSHALSAPSWPPVATETDVVMAGGFPGIARSPIPSTGIPLSQFLFPTYMRRIEGVRSDRLSVVLGTEDAYSTQGLMPTANPNLGGASGGPLFRVRSGGLVLLELVGIIYEYMQSAELLFARPVTLVAHNGKLVR
jgi:hypothetical protein